MGVVTEVLRWGPLDTPWGRAVVGGALIVAGLAALALLARLHGE